MFQNQVGGGPVIGQRETSDQGGNTAGLKCFSHL